MDKLRELQNTLLAKRLDLLDTGKAEFMKSFIEGIECALIAIHDMITAEDGPQYNIVRTVPSTDKWSSKEYDIRYDHKNKVVSCSCEAWKFSKASPKTCKHIKKVLPWLRKQGIKI